jgi:hypothetical protein
MKRGANNMNPYGEGNRELHPNYLSSKNSNGDNSTKVDPILREGTTVDLILREGSQQQQHRVTEPIRDTVSSPINTNNNNTNNNVNVEINNITNKLSFRNKKAFMKESNRIDKIRATPRRGVAKLAIANIWSIETVQQNPTGDDSSNISEGEARDNTGSPRVRSVQQTLNAFVTAQNNLTIDFTDVYRLANFARETNVLAKEPSLNLDDFIQSTIAWFDLATKVAQRRHTDLNTIKKILRSAGELRKLAIIRLGENFKYKIKYTKGCTNVPHANFEDVPADLIVQLDTYVSTASKLPKEASSYRQNLGIKYNLLMIQSNTTKINETLLAKKMAHDIHKLANFLVGNRKNLEKIHTKLDTNKVFKVLKSSISETNFKGEDHAIHRQLAERVWMCIHNETKHTTLHKRVDVMGGCGPLEGQYINSKNDSVDCVFIDHHSNFTTSEYRINGDGDNVKTVRSILPTPILKNHNPLAEDMSATSAMNQSLRKNSNFHKHINLNNIQGICTQQLFATLHKLLNDQSLPDRLTGPFRLWVSSNIKCDKITGQISFLESCLRSKIIPSSIRAMVPLENWRVTSFSPEDLLLSLIRSEIIRLRTDKIELEKAKDDNWVLWNKRLDDRNTIKEICIAMNLWNVICTELNHSTHVHKFNSRSRSTPHFCGDAPPSIELKGKNLNIIYKEKCTKNHYPHNIYDYLNKMRLPCRPQLLRQKGIKTDDLVNGEGRYFKRRDHIPMEKEYTQKPPVMTEDREDNINKLNDFLQKRGKNFAIPSLEERENATLATHIKIDRLRFGIRHKINYEERLRQTPQNHINDWDTKAQRYVPFATNHVNLPDKADRITEGNIEELRRIILATNDKAMEIEKEHRKDWNKIKKFLKEERLMIIGTDKTGNNKLVPYDAYKKMGLDFLNNNEGYKKIHNPNIQLITKQCNEAITKIAKCRSTTLSGRDIKKLKRHNAKPSKFFLLIKDHKEKNNEGQWPIRPIASIHGTPMDAIDWITSTILNQALGEIPAHLFDADQIMKSIKDLNENKPNKGWYRNVISLDVINLYPSIPTKYGIKVIMNFLRNNSQIDTFGIPFNIIEELLELTFNNYMVNFEGSIYLQTKGAPMGARTSVAYSIIVMNHIEHLALGCISERLKKEDFKLQLYRRYIDDTLIVFDHKNKETLSELGEKIKNIFNEVIPDIQFTSEIPNKQEWLPFLNTQLRVNNKGNILAKWYQKATHGGNILSPLSHVSNKTKSNFLKNTFTTVKKRSNFTIGYLEGLEFTYRQLLNNGYNHAQIKTAFYASLNTKLKWRTNTNAYAENNIDKLPLKLPFRSNEVNKIITQKIRSMNIPAKLINTQNIKLNSLSYSEKQKPTCGICFICRDNPPDTCKTKNIVYKLTCNICADSYIGMTNRLTKTRMEEHAYDIRTEKLEFGPGAHLRDKHPYSEHNFGLFRPEVIYKCRGEIDTRITEKRLIKINNPAINRTYKNEETMYRKELRKKHNTNKLT